jgi:poly-gamma-glutamate capsule biosynthesis protein CapA/YwtB (metallophosphatase superfamily)
VVIVALTLSSGDSAAGRSGGEPAAATRKQVPSTRRAEPRTAVVEIAATGDIALGATPELPPDGGRSLFAGVERELRGDLVLGNLETALTSSGTSKCRPGSTECFSFRAPPAYARHLKRAGFTLLNLANNHSFDFGTTGQAETVEALDAARLQYTGRPGEIAYQRVGGVRIAIVGFAPYPWAQDLRDLEDARRIVRRASTAADLVVVTMHAGAEGNASTHVPVGVELHLGEQRGDTRAFAHAVIDAGADLVLGHGPHVLRGLEWYRSRLVAYSLGNFASYRNFAHAGPSGISGILKVTLAADGSWRGGRLVPVRLVGNGTPEPGGAGIAAIRALSKSDFGASAMQVAENGELSSPAERACGRARWSARTARNAASTEEPSRSKYSTCSH